MGIGPDMMELAATLGRYAPLLIAVVLIVSGVLIAVRRPDRGAFGLAAVRRVLEGQFRVAHGVTIADPHDSSRVVTIEHAVRLRNAVACIERFDLAGRIIGNARKDEWTVMEDKDAYIIHNPLRPIMARAKALETRVPGPQFKVLAVFANNTDFPEGMPPGCCRVKELVSALRKMEAQGVGTKVSDVAWHAIDALADSQMLVEGEAKDRGESGRIATGLAFIGIGVATAIAGLFLRL